MKPKSLREWSFLSVVSAAVFCGVAALHAQTITAGVTGTVTDGSGAVVPDTTVIATNVATNVTTPAQTNQEGIFNIRLLPVGTYTVEVSHPGFQAKRFGPFVLESGQIAKLDAALTIGSSTVVDVNGAVSPLINTQNAELGTTIDTKAIENAPLVGRDFAELTQFLPGSVANSPANFSGAAAIERANFSNDGGWISVNGNRAATNNYLLDGIEINETINNTIALNPSPDSLSEVHVITSNASAEFGNVNGGDVIAITKSGSDVFHGSAFYFLSDSKLDANSWSNKHANPHIARTPYTQNIFGGTLGGPIFRSKAFFFVDYEGARYHSGGSALASVATAKMRTGDFSELLNPALCTNRAAVTCSQMTQLYDSQNNFAPFPGNLNVPITNPVASFIFSHPEIYPLPNATPVAGTVTTNNYIGPVKSIIHNDQFDAKVDYKQNDSNSGFVRYTQGTAGDRSVLPLELLFPSFNEYPTRQVALTFIHTFSPAIQNEFRAGFTRVVWHQQIFSDPTGLFPAGTGNGAVGIQNPPGNPQAISGFSQQVIPGLSSLGTARSGSDNAMNNFSYVDNLTWQVKSHLLKFGAEVVREQQNISYPGGAGQLGNMSYSGTFSANPAIPTTPSTISASGSSIADWVMDRVLTSAHGASATHRGQRQWRTAAFAQDDWKATPNLTVNLGVRWEYDQPLYEVQNREVNVDFANQALVYAGQKGQSRALYNGTWTNFMPRVGFAYTLTPTLVVRGGFGSTMFLEGTGASLRPIVNPPFLFQTSYTGVPTSYTSSNQTYSRGSFLTAETAFSSLAGSTPSLNAWDKDLKPALINEYSLTLEKQFTPSLSLRVGYVGESGHHLIQAIKGNQLYSACFLANGSAASPNSPGCIASNPAPLLKLFENFGTFMPSSVQPYYPSPGYAATVSQNANTTLTASHAMMNYNGLQATLRQRTSHGLEFVANYTYAKAMSNSLGFFGLVSVNGPSAYAENAYNNHAEYGPMATDVRHNLNFITTYELPFGRGHQWLANDHAFVDQVVGGWRASMTGVACTGMPTTIANSTNNTFVNSGTQRANQYRHIHIVNRSISHWFGTDASATSCSVAGVDNGVCAYGSPANGTFGSAAVDTERVPGFRSFDASLFKDFHLYRQNILGFRADASNVFNISSYGPPTVSAQSTNFGLITTTRSLPRQMQLSLKYSF